MLNRQAVHSLETLHLNPPFAILQNHKSGIPTQNQRKTQHGFLSSIKQMN